MTSTDTQGISDEQIAQLARQHINWKEYDGEIEFARAVLALQPEAAMGVNEWKRAIDDELVSLESTADSYPSAKAAVKALIDWHVSVALDPRISSDAQALVDQALEEAKPALAEAAYDAAINYAQGREVDWNRVIEDAIRRFRERK